MKYIEGYLPKNKKLSRLARLARIQWVLKGEISQDLWTKIMNAINCDNCRYKSNDGIVIGGQINSCKKIGIKHNVSGHLYVRNLPEGDKFIYCAQFEEK